MSIWGYNDKKQYDDYDEEDTSIEDFGLLLGGLIAFDIGLDTLFNHSNKDA